MGIILLKTSKEDRQTKLKNLCSFIKRRNKMSLQPRNVARLAQACIRQKSTSTVKNANQAAEKYTSSSGASSTEKKKSYSDTKNGQKNTGNEKYQRQGHLLWHLL